MKKITHSILPFLLALGAAGVAGACSAKSDSGGDKNTNDDSSGNEGGNPDDSLNVDGNGNGVDVIGQLPSATCAVDCADFPLEPVIVGGAAPDAATQFGAPETGTAGSTCIHEPHLSAGSSPGVMVPANWQAPRVRFTPDGGDLFEIRFSSEVQANDFVAYTTSTEYIMPRDVWVKAAANNGGKSITVTVRALTSGSGAAPTISSGSFEVAPVNAGGSLVFWTVNSSVVTPDASKLFGFSVGDEGVVETLRPANVEMNAITSEEGIALRNPNDDDNISKPGFQNGEVQCIGCHISTPDGEAVLFTDDWAWNKGIASVGTDNSGDVPSYVTPGAIALMKMPFMGTQAVSEAHWGPGDRKVLTTRSDRQNAFVLGPWPAAETVSKEPHRLMWIDLEQNPSISAEITSNPDDGRTARNTAIQAAKGTAWNIMATTGVSANESVVLPDWSNDGETVTFVTTDSSPNGHPAWEATTADIWTVPYNGGAGGEAKPLLNSPDLEYYPTFSADDELIAFNKAPSDKGHGPYQNPFAEINIMPASGGMPHRLAANDPVACNGDNLGAGLINSWPKWSPHVVSHEGKSYYFLIFSSARKYPGSYEIPKSFYTPAGLDTRSSQLYMATVVRDDASGEFTSYPASYLWNQNTIVDAAGNATDGNFSNMTPAWDEFVIPEVPIIVR